MHIMTVANQKGGCGKTTTSINLASTFAINGKKVLLLDLDPQAHASLGLNIESQNSIYNVISKLTPRKLSLSDIIVKIEDSFDLAPSNILVGTLEQELADEIGRELKLKEALATIENNYDVILIDCPPSLGFLTVNAIRASSDIVIPVETSKFSLQGVERLMDIVNLIKERLNHSVTSKILITMFDSRLRHSFSMLAKIKDKYADMMFDTIVHTNVKLKESVVMGQTVAAYDKYSRGFKDYFSLARELISSWEGAKVGSSFVFRSRINQHLKKEVKADKDTDRIAQEDLVDTSLDSPQGRNIKIQNVDESNLAIFTLDAPAAESVYITGSFNAWSLDESCRLQKDNGLWKVQLSLKPGRYQYRFIVDGKWQEDPRNPVQEKNPFGEVNSLVEVK